MGRGWARREIDNVEGAWPEEEAAEAKGKDSAARVEGGRSRLARCHPCTSLARSFEGHCRQCLGLPTSKAANSTTRQYEDETTSTESSSGISTLAGVWHVEEVQLQRP